MMSSYAIFFDYDNKTYRLPTNPEEIEISSTQAIDKYEVLKLGQIAIPTHMELKEYSFECEFLHTPLYYVETAGGFKDADYYLKLFTEWRDKLVPVRFISTNGLGDDINTLVLIEDITVVEKAGEEGDKYVKFKLIEYKKFGKKSIIIEMVEQVNNTTGTPVTEVTAVKKAVNNETTSPRSVNYYVVESGDSLWAIAKKYYGNGRQYTKIYEANKNKIKNPNLIRVGQKLVIP